MIFLKSLLDSKNTPEFLFSRFKAMQYMNDLKGRRLGRMKVEFIEDGDEDEDFNTKFDKEGAI